MEYRIVELLKEIKSLITGNKEDKWMDINEASKYCSCHPSTLRRNVASGQLSCSNKPVEKEMKMPMLVRW